MKKILFILTLTLMLIVTNGSSAMAAWSFHLDNSDMDNIFDVWFVTDSSVVIDNYQLNFEYDSMEMDYLSYTNNQPLPLTPDLMGNLTEQTPGYLHNFNAAVFFGDGATVDSNILLATLTFDILPTAVIDGSDDLWFVSTPGFGITLNSVWYNYETFQDPDFAGEHITYGSGLDVGTPVPIPAAIWLLGSGLLGLMGLRRGRKIS